MEPFRLSPLTTLCDEVEIFGPSLERLLGFPPFEF